MGVMTCDKKGCDNILCDTLIEQNYYICNECKDEFKIWIQGQIVLCPESHDYMLDKFKEFMNIKKRSRRIKIVSDAVDNFFNSYGAY